MIQDMVERVQQRLATCGNAGDLKKKKKKKKLANFLCRQRRYHELFSETSI